MLNVRISSGFIYNLLPDNTTGNITGNWIYKASPTASLQGTITGTGTVGGTITIQVSNDGINPIVAPAGTITLSGPSPVSDGFLTVNSPWKFIRAVVTGVSGSVNNIQVLMGI